MVKDRAIRSVGCSFFYLQKNLMQDQWFEQKFSKARNWFRQWAWVVLGIWFLYSLIWNPFARKEPVDPQQKQEVVNDIFKDMESQNEQQAAFNTSRYFEYQDIEWLMLPVPRWRVSVQDEQQEIPWEWVVHHKLWIWEPDINGAYIIELWKGLADAVDPIALRDSISEWEITLISEKTWTDIFGTRYLREFDNPVADSMKMMVWKILDDSIWVTLTYEKPWGQNFWLEDFKYLSKKIFENSAMAERSRK